MIVNKKIGFIGIGQMGSGMVTNLLQAGHKVVLFDTVKEKCLNFKEHAVIARDHNELFNVCNLLMISLPGSPQVEEVVEAFINSGIKNKVIIDFSTSSPKSSMSIYHKVKPLGGNFMDAPVIGTPDTSQKATSILKVGAERELYEELEPLLRILAKKVDYVGTPGSGNVMKLVINYIGIVSTAVYAEVLSFVEKIGIDPQIVYDSMQDSASNSVLFQRNAAKIINDDYEPHFQLELALKDLIYLKNMYDDERIPSMLLDAGVNLYKIAYNQGLGKLDLTAIGKAAKTLIKRSIS